MPEILRDDVQRVLARTTGLWEELRGRRLFLTGGTGFFGCWLLETFLGANEHLGLEAEAVVLTRRPEAFRRKAAHLASHPAVRLHEGDVRSFDFPAGEFPLVVHAATEPGAGLDNEALLRTFDVIVGGTRRVLDFAVSHGARKFLLVSSGAVYGPQPPDLAHVPEDYRGGPDPAAADSAYAEGKRAAECQGLLYARRYGIEVKIARGFAFVGPHLPLGIHYAIGNFIRDGLAGGPIVVKGDGTPVRSYLYAADLAAWLWTILFRGASGRPYNVGAEEGLSIAEIARVVSEACASAKVQILQSPAPGAIPQRYVPSTARARTELGLVPTVDLTEAVRRTVQWHRAGGRADAGERD